MGIIESKQIVGPDLLGPLREEIKLTEAQLESMDAALVKSLQTQSKLAAQIKTSTSGLKKMNEINRQSKTDLSEKEKVEKKIIAVRKQSTQVSKLQRQTLAELRVEEQRRNKIARETAKATNKNIGSFERLNIKIKKLSDEYRNLIVQEGKETKQSKLLRKRILELNAARDKANQSIGIHGAKVGKYENALKRLTGTLAKMGLAFGAFQILRNVFGTIKTFEQSTADLSAVLGVNIDQMGRLTAQAKELGSTTIFTAAEILALQESFAKLGFTQKEIEGVTEATLQLAAATGSDLGESATVVGSTLRAFGMDVSETQRVVDVMAKSFSASSLDMEKFTVAMRAVAPVAKNAGFNIEQTTALLGSITDAGVDASTAGTGLRNVFLELAKSGMTFDEAMAQIANSSNKNATSLALFGKRGAVIGTILSETGDKADQLTETLENAGGAAGEMADKQLDTLGGALKLLTSAWEGFILELNESSGAGEALKNVIVFLAKNFKVIMKVIIGVVKVWIAYRLQLKLSALAMKIYRVEVIKGIAVSKGMIPSLVKMAKGFKFASISAKGFGTALKGIPFLAIASGIFTVVSLIWDSADASDAANESTSALDQTIKEINKNYLEERAELAGVFQALRSTTAGTLERQEALDIVNDKYGLTLENLADETAFVEQLNVAYLDLLATMEKRIKTEIVKERLTELLKEKIALEEMVKLEKERAKLFSGPSDFNLEGDFNMNQAEKDAAAFQERINQINGLITDLQDNVSVTDLLGGPEGTPTGGSGGGGGKKSKEDKDEATRARIRFKDLQDANKDNLDVLENQLLKSGATKEEIEKGLYLKRIENLRRELEFSKENFSDISEEYILTSIKLQNELNKISDDGLKSQAEINKQAFEDLKSQNSENLEEIENNLLKEGASKEAIEKALSAARIENLKKENDFTLKKFGEFSEEYKAANLALNRALVTQDEIAAKKRQDIQEQLIRTVRDALADAAGLVESFLQNNLTLIDRQIAAQEKLFNQSKDRESELIAIAKEKGLNADESINAEREAQKAAALQQRELEIKRQRAEALIAALQAFAAQVQAGQGNPVQNIKGSILSLKSFVEGEFIDGTEYTLGDSLGYNGKQDGHFIAADDKEAIFNPNQTSALNIGKGKNSTSDIVNMYKNGFRQNTDSLNSVAAANVGDKKLHSKIDKLIKATENIVDPNGLAFDVMSKTLNYKNKSKGALYRFPVSKK